MVRVLMRHRAELIGYAWLVVGDADLAEDVFQDVSVAAIRKCDEIRDEKHLVGWLYRAIRLQGLKARRDAQHKKQLLDPALLELIEQAREQADPAHESDRVTALRECIHQLQGVTREILELRYARSLKPADIATKTGKKVQTVYKTITRAHSALRDCVQHRLTGGEGGR